MWFKQVQLFDVSHSVSSYSAEKLIEKLQALAFKPCLPSLPSSAGWVPPADEEGASLVRIINACCMICLQIEEKILPATVIRQALAEKIKQIELAEDRKVYQKEKLALKDEIILTLLPRAFTKTTRIYAYLDTKNNWLLLGTSNQKKTEQFISLFKKTITEDIYPLEIEKISPALTQWLQHKNFPSSFNIEKACVLQDPRQQTRIIRVQQQDLFAKAIQALIKDGCEIKQLALSWQDRVNFVLAHDFSLSGIKFNDAILAEANDLEPETKQQRIDADFLMMTASFSQLLKELLSFFVKSKARIPELAEV